MSSEMFSTPSIPASAEAIPSDIVHWRNKRQRARAYIETNHQV